MNVEGDMIRDYTKLDSFVIYMCVEGSLEITYENIIFNLNKGETILLPAVINKVKLTSARADILEVSM